MGFSNPLAGIQQTLQQLAVQSQSPQAKALEARLEQQEREKQQGQLITEFLASADLNKLRPSDIMARVASITGDPGLVNNFVQQRFKEGLFAEERERFQELGEAVTGFAEGGISPEEQAQIAGEVLSGGGSPQEVQQLRGLTQGQAQPAGQFTTLSPKEVADVGLPVGTVAQRSPEGKVSVVQRAEGRPGAPSSAAELGLFRELQDQVTRKERTPEAASTLFEQETGKVRSFTPGIARGEEKSLKRIAAEAEVRAQATQKVKTRVILRDVKSITKDLDSVLGLFAKIPSELKGPLAGRTVGQAAKFVKGSENLTAFEDFKEFILSNISRQLGGERGVLTDRDVERIGSALPNLQDSPKSAALKIKQIRDFVKRRVANKQATLDEPLAVGTRGGIETAPSTAATTAATTAVQQAPAAAAAPAITSDAVQAHINRIKGR